MTNTTPTTTPTVTITLANTNATPLMLGEAIRDALAFGTDDPLTDYIPNGFWNDEPTVLPLTYMGMTLGTITLA